MSSLTNSAYNDNEQVGLRRRQIQEVTKFVACASGEELFGKSTRYYQEKLLNAYPWTTEIRRQYMNKKNVIP